MDREDGVRAILQIASCRPHAIAYGCTASRIIQGDAFDERLRTEIRHIADLPATMRPKASSRPATRSA
jgi:maleate isomerase